MDERGTPFSGHYPKSVASVSEGTFDLVVTIGAPARTLLPQSRFPSAHWAHWDIPDPAAADGTPDSEAAFQAAAREIENRLPALCRRVEESARLRTTLSRP